MELTHVVREGDERRPGGGRVAGVGGWLMRATARFPEHEAVRYGAESWMYDAFHDRVARIASALASNGLAPGDRVAVLQWNNPDLLATMLAAFHGGYCVVPINARSTVDEVTVVLEDAGAAAVVYAAEYAEHAASASPAPLRICTRPGHGEDAVLDDLVSSASPLMPVDVRPDEPAWLFYTSGTTGQPKGAVLTHRKLSAMVMAYLADIRATSSAHRVLHAAPLTHGSGLYALPAVARGATQVLTTSRSYDPGEVLQLIRDLDVTDIAFLTPTMLKRMCEAAGAEWSLASLEHIVYGGAPMYADDLKAALGRFGPVLSQIYGQAEAPVTISRMTREEHANAVRQEPGLLSSTGFAYANSEVAVLDGHGQVRRYGEGEILTRGDAVMPAYWRNSAATEQAFIDGWLCTGDLGRVDPDGRLWLLDRSKDVIISGGANIYPREIEDVISDHPDVSQVAVVGAPDDEWGERVVAVLVLQPDVDAEVATAGITALCRSRLAGYKLPRQFDLRGHLPTSSYGKVLKRELRASTGLTESAGSDGPGRERSPHGP